MDLMLNMSPDEVINQLQDKGIQISRRMLLRFENAGLIPLPKRGSGGRGQGRYTDYADTVVEKFFAAWMLIKTQKLTYEEAKKIIEKEENDYSLLLDVIKTERSRENEMSNEDANSMVDKIFKDNIKALKALAYYLEGKPLIDRNALYRAQKLLEVYLSNDIGEEISGLMDLLKEDNSKREGIINISDSKYSTFQSLATLDLAEVAQEVAFYKELSEKYKSELMKLKKENKHLHELLEQSKPE